MAGDLSRLESMGVSWRLKVGGAGPVPGIEGNKDDEHVYGSGSMTMFPTCTFFLLSIFFLSLLSFYSSSSSSSSFFFTF